jgi:hypothetical protein
MKNCFNLNEPLNFRHAKVFGKANNRQWFKSKNAGIGALEHV